VAQQAEITPLVHPIEAVSVRLGGMGRSTIYKEIAAGRLRSVKLAGRRMVPESALLEYIELLEREAAQ